MTDNMVFVITAILAVAFVILFLKSGSSRSLTDQKRADVERRRTAIRAKRRAEAQAAAKAKSNVDQ